MRGHIAQALYKNCLTPASASKLRGRLGFPTPLLMAELRRGTMGALISRQYGSYAYLLSSELKRNLLWGRNAIGALHPRSLPPALHAPTGARSGAPGNGRIAARSLLPPDISFSTHLPHWFVERAFSADGGRPIYLSELAVTAKLPVLRLIDPTVILAIASCASIIRRPSMPL